MDLPPAANVHKRHAELKLKRSLSEGLLGTPAYLAPERLEQGAVRPATDVYTLGLLLYRTLAGRLPWQASTTTEMLTAHRYQEPAALPDRTDLPAEIGDLCRRCLAKDPADRPPATEAASVLGVVAGLPPTTLLLPDAGTSAEPTQARTWARTLGPVADLPASPLVAVPLERWRRLPAPRRAAVAGAAAVTLLASAVAAVALSAGSTGDGTPAGARTPTAVVGIGPRPPECSVRYALSHAVNGRSSTRISIANTGSVPIDDARLAFSLPDRQRLVQGSPGTWRQSGDTVQARIGDLPPRRTVTATVAVTYQEATSLPDQFRLNDTPCRSTLAVAGQTSRPAPRSGGKEDDKKGEEDKKGKEEESDD
ncbi:protein kinase [Micromonospora sp. DPT]|uniref:protein kinase domain-containing protein n=1 Tax=Micromonospora sp. DPT TaxID=3142975 RepID=UPI00320B6CD8